MADMCGPSNALSNFQKHSTVDRTLQQDRLISRQPPSQGFRSAPVPNARHLDPEFEAFQAGNLPLDNGFQQGPQGFAQQNLRAGPANWASDFQRMGLSSPPPGQQFQQQGFEEQVQQRHDAEGWHQDFARQQNQMAGPSIAQSEQQAGYMQRFPTMSGGLGMTIGPQYGGYAGTQQVQMGQQTEEQFDEEAFAKAFDEAAKAEQEQKQGMELGQDILITKSAERLMSSSPDLIKPLDQAPIGADTIHDPNIPQDQQKQEDPDSLARTAKRLLDSVAHDESEKMKGSMFMELMRQFRDGEKGVRGEEVVSRNDQEMVDEDMKMRKISNVSYALKKAILDRDRPFIRSPGAVRSLLLNLLQLDRLLDSSSTTKEMIERSRIRRTLAAMISSPSLNGLPSIRILAIYLLSAISKLQSSSENNTDIQNQEAGRLSGNDMADISIANREITHFDPDSRVSGGRYEDGEFSTLEEEYISKALRVGEEGGTKEGTLSSLLGYSITPSTADNMKSVHQQRAKDILGPSISAVMSITKNRGIFCAELKASEFWELVDIYEEKGLGGI